MQAGAREIEHKFVVESSEGRGEIGPAGPESDVLAALAASLMRLGPPRTGRAQVTERYYRSGALPGRIVRHACDAERQSLVAKSHGGPDTEVRWEATLRLDLRGGDQHEQVVSLLSGLGFAPCGTVHKSLHAFYFDDCEVVCYQARAGDREVICVEFEALHTGDVDAARAVLERYERATGFWGRERERRSLFDLLLG